MNQVNEMEFQNKFANLLLSFRYTRDEGDQESLGSMYKKVLQIAWPAALEGLLLTLMNSFDTMMVGKLGSPAITSVGLCAQPRMIILLVAQAICTGTMAVIARRKGENRQDAANSCLRQSMLLVTFIGIAMTILGIVLAKPLLLLAGAGEDTLADAVIYFQIISMAFIPNCWAICICSAMRGIGKTRITMVVNVSANVFNIFFNYCLIGGRLGFPALGVKGAAIATAIGTVVSSIIALVVVFQKGGYLSLRPFKGFRFDRATLGSIIKVGSGTILESVCMRIGFLINGKLIAGVGTAAFAASQIVGQVSSLTFCVGDGVSSACTSLVGQSLGANTKRKAMAYVRVGERICIFLSVAIMLMTFFGRDWLPTLFSEEKDVIFGCSISFLVLLLGIYPQNMRVMIAGCLRGAGDVRYVALVSLISVAILRPLLTWLCCYPLNALFPNAYLAYLGPWISFDIDAIVRWVLLHVRVKKGQWVNIKL